jgi:hypothetical protein
MKKLIVILLFIVFGKAQAQDSLTTFNLNREHIKKNGMEVLGSWAIAHIALGTIASSNTTGSVKYYYQMDALWNVINLGAAVSGYISAINNAGRPLSVTESLKQQRQTENIFLINGGLDVGYIGAGIFLNHRGSTTNSNQLQGYGSSIIVQGAFLLLFDATMYTAEKHNGNKLRRFLERNPVIFDNKKIGMIINF